MTDHAIRRLLAIVVAAIALAGIVAVLVTGSGSYASAGSGLDHPGRGDEQDERRLQRRPHRFTVDIAENGTRFAFDEAPVIEGGDLDGFPDYGNPFVTEGYIYPEGTLDGTNGVNPDGSPEFPDKVIGQWLCRGYFVGDGAATTEGAWVYTTQQFAFGDDPDSGAETLIVTGYETSEVGGEGSGAVTGGTGRYALARGEALQTLLGFNNADLPTMGIVKRVAFDVRP